MWPVSFRGVDGVDGVVVPGADWRRVRAGSGPVVDRCLVRLGFEWGEAERLLGYEGSPKRRLTDKGGS